MKLNRKKCSLLVLFLFFSTMPVYAWWPISHYVIAKYAAKKKGIPESVKNYANLPDYVHSSESYWAISQIIGHYFTWTHGVIDIGNNGLAPKVPEFADDGRYPGLIMQELLKNKLKSKKIKGNVLKDYQNTVNGFRAHNAADRTVHWGFFLGGDKDKWVIHHGLKECLAEYNILLLYGYGGDEGKMFSKKGLINRKTLNTTIIPSAGPGFMGNAELMHIAQKVYRKNRRVLRKGEDEQLNVQSVSEIKKLIKKQNKNPLTQASWATWEVAYVNLVGDFTVYEWNPATNQYDEITIDPDTPKNNEAELENLLYYQLHTLQSFKTPMYAGNGGRMFGNNNADDDWKVWDDATMRAKFNESIDQAKDWMFTLQELTPDN